MPNWPTTNLKTSTFEWTMSNQYDECKLCSRVHGELVPSSGHTRWMRWLRCPPAAYTKFPWYHWPPEMEPVGTCWCDWQMISVATKKSVKSFLDHLASQMDHTVYQQMPNISIRRCANQAWRNPRWIGRPSKGPCTDRCNFPTDEEKDWNVQFHLVLCTHRQWSVQEIACSWPQGHNSQDAQNIQDSQRQSRQPQCYGLLGPKLSMLSTNEANDLSSCPQQQQQQQQNHWTPRIKHACRKLHKIPCTWQSLLHF